MFAYFDESMGCIGGYEPWWSWNTVDIMLIWNWNEFTTVPKGSDLLYYTNGSHEGFVKFCVDEVYEDQGVIDMRRIRRGKGSSLGMPRLASHLSSSTIIGIPRFLFCSHDMRLLCLFLFYFPICSMLVWDSPSLICRMLFVLHLNTLSMAL